MSPISTPTEMTVDARPLAGGHAVVTGGSQGIGLAIAAELGRLGAGLTLLARTAARLAEARATLAAQGIPARDMAVDLTDAEAAERAFAAAAAFAPIDILIANAGGAESAPFSRTTPELWARMIEANLTSVYRSVRCVAPAMTKRGRGRIVAVASTAGLKGYAYVSAYCAAKHGVIGLVRSLALEFARSGVTVNAVCPGYTDTPMIDAAVATIAAKTGRGAEDARAGLAAVNPLGRLVRPEEVAAAVGWLCLPSSAAVTGQAIAVAGGEVP